DTQARCLERESRLSGSRARRSSGPAASVWRVLCHDLAVDGVHDMGGMHGYGRVPIEVDEPLFHEPWEGRVWAMWSAIGATTVDRFRFTIEGMPPAVYLASTYYERWLWAIERLAAEQGLLTGPDRPPGGSRPSPGLPSWVGRFQPGDAVRV